MAQFNADINLEVKSRGAERQVRKIERSINKVEEASRDILGVEKQIVKERRQLARLSGEQAARTRRRINDLSLQKTELSLQRRELQQIVRLEKRRADNVRRASTAASTAGDSSGGGGGIGVEVLGAAALATSARALTPAALVSKSKALQSLQEFRDRQNDAVEAAIEDLEEKTRIYRQKLNRFNEVRAKRPLLTSKGTFQPATRTSRNALFRAREDLFTARRDAGFGSNFVEGIDKSIAGLNKELEQNRRIVSKARTPLSGLVKQLAVTATAYVGVDQAVRQVTASIQAATRAASAEQRIRALSDGFDNYADVLEVAARASERFNLSTIQSQDAVAQLYGRLRPLGLTLDEIETVFSGFNTAAALTGATAAESAGALLQLSQALGAGALRGEEFNSIAEQAPAVLQAIAREIDKPVGALKELAKEGELTSDIVIRALERVEREGADKLAAALDTPAQKFVTLQNRVEDLQVALGNLILPETIQLLEGLAGAATAAATEVDKLALAKAGLKRSVDNATKGVEDFINQIPTLRDLMPVAIRLTEVWAGVMDTLRVAVLRNIPGLGQIVFLLEQIERLRGGIDTLAINEQAARALENRGGMESGGIPVWDGEKYVYDDPPKVDPLRKRLGIQIGDVVDPSIGQGSSSEKDFDDKALQAGIRAAELADEAAEDRRIALRDADQLLERLTAQIRVQNSITDLERITNQLALDRLEIEQDIANRMEDADAALAARLKREQTLRERLAIDENTRPFFDAGYEMGQELAEFKTESAEIARIWNGIGGAVNDVLFSLVDGTEDLNAVLADTLRSLSKLLFSAGLNLLGGNDGKGLFSILGGNFGGARADGGPVSAGKGYLIGERGPELLVPGRSGTIIPNDALTTSTRSAAGGGVVVNQVFNVEKGTSSTSVQGGGDEAAARDLARTMEKVTLAVITREKRPGGSLSR